MKPTEINNNLLLKEVKFKTEVIMPYNRKEMVELTGTIISVYTSKDKVSLLIGRKVNGCEWFNRSYNITNIEDVELL